MCIESVELIVAFKISDASSISGVVNISTELLADKAFVFNILYVADAELSVISKETVGVLAVLLVTIIDFIIIVSSVPAVSIDVCEVDAIAAPLYL